MESVHLEPAERLVDEGGGRAWRLRPAGKSQDLHSLLRGQQKMCSAGLCKVKVS